MQPQKMRKPVFRLQDHPASAPSHLVQAVASCGCRPLLTAAGPYQIRTGFPSCTAKRQEQAHGINEPGALRNSAVPRRQMQSNTGCKHEARQKRHAKEREGGQEHKKRACREIPAGPFRSKPRHFASGAASAGFSAGAGAGSGAGAFSSVAAGLMLSNRVSLYFQSA